MLVLNQINPGLSAMGAPAADSDFVDITDEAQSLVVEDSVSEELSSAPNLSDTARRFATQSVSYVGTKARQVARHVYEGARALMEPPRFGPQVAYAGAAHYHRAVSSPRDTSLFSLLNKPFFVMQDSPDERTIDTGASSGSSGSDVAGNPADVSFIKRFISGLINLAWDGFSYDGTVHEWQKSYEGKSDKIDGLLQSQMTRGITYEEGDDISSKIAGKISAELKRMGIVSRRGRRRVKLIEFGSGNLMLARVMEKVLGVGVVKTDMLEPCRAEADRDFHKVDFTALPFGEGAFPLGFSTYSLEYSGEPAFAEAYRVLMPGGALVAVVHHRDSAIVKWNRTVNRFLISGSFYLARNIKLFGIPLASMAPLKMQLQWECNARLMYELNKVAFARQNDVHSMLEEIGFENVSVTPFVAGKDLGRIQLAPADLGWLVVARKPGEYVGPVKGRRK